MYKIKKIGLLAHYNPHFPPAARAISALRARTATRRETGVSTQDTRGRNKCVQSKKVPPDLLLGLFRTV